MQILPIANWPIPAWAASKWSTGAAIRVHNWTIIHSYTLQKITSAYLLRYTLSTTPLICSSWIANRTACGVFFSFPFSPFWLGREIWSEGYCVWILNSIMHITVLYLGIFGIYSSTYILVYQIDRGQYPDDMQPIQCMNPIYCLDIYCREYIYTCVSLDPCSSVEYIC